MDKDRNFGWALEHLRSGKKLRRRSWKDKDRYLSLQIPDDTSVMTTPYIYIGNNHGLVTPWFTPHVDLLSEDWEILRKEGE